MQKAYAAAVAQSGYQHDAAQETVVSHLQHLQQDLERVHTLAGRLRRLLPGSGRDPLRGIYLWGGVGRGKTFLMDLFYTSLAVERKRRVHFHRMLQDVHARLKRLDNVSDPLDRVASQLATEVRVLCFDEFFVSDIGDAMILGKLLQGLFERDVIMVATSNSRPADLYRDGLQRERFLPAIDLIERHMRVVELGGETDYRLRLLQEAGTYLTPADARATERLSRYFDEIASGDSTAGQALDILGRSVETRRSAKGVAWFDFEAICDGPRSQDDYIEIARWYPTVIVSGVPLLTRETENQARRFIAMVDEFYDRRVKLLISAAARADLLYRGEKLRFEFERTASRLIEMQSAEYLHAAHLA